jgi:hypothetical protein
VTIVESALRVPNFDAYLTSAQRAKLVAKRKAAYEAVHPETKQGATGRGGGNDAK